MSWFFLLVLLILLLSLFFRIVPSNSELKARKESMQDELGTEINFIMMSVRFPQPLGWVTFKVNSEKQRLFCFRINHYVWQFLIFLFFLYFVLV